LGAVKPNGRSTGFPDDWPCDDLAAVKLIENVDGMRKASTGAPQSLLDELLGAWAYTREGVIAEVRNLPDELTGSRPTPRSRTLAELALHIVESGLMMSGELTRADGNFARPSASSQSNSPFAIFCTRSSSDRTRGQSASGRRFASSSRTPRRPALRAPITST